MSKHDGLDLLPAFPDMPEDCRSTLHAIVRSVKEEEPVKRKYPAAILIAILLILMTTIAIAEGWNVLSFLRLQPDSDAQTLVQPVSASAGVDNCTIRIDSAITDGEYLVFDWTVENTRPETPIYLRVEDFTANGQQISIDGNDDFHNKWLPGWCNEGAMMDGELVTLPDSLTGDTLHVEMVVGVYTPDRPVCHIDEFDREAVQAKLDEGYYVIVGGDGILCNDPEVGLMRGFPGSTMNHAVAGLVRSEMKVSFDLDLKTARASLRTPELPAPVIRDDTTLAVQSIAISPLQTRVIATFTPENASYEDIVRWSDGMNFTFYDESGSKLDYWSMCLTPLYEITVEEAPDGTWYRRMDYTLIEVEQSLPETILLAYTTEDGFHTELPIRIK